LSLRHALLGALADRPRTGYALLRHFEQSLGYAWPASHSQIYPELARLLAAGLIRQSAAGARNSKTYELTDAGLTEIRRWLRESEPERRVRSDAALRPFFLWLLEQDEAAGLLERERAHWLGRLGEYERLRDTQGEPRSRKEQAFRIALEAGIRDAETRLEWLTWALERVRSRRWRSLPATAGAVAISAAATRASGSPPGAVSASRRSGARSP
jgi:PadR family transcriptional regulator, regulatory protein AphA